MPSFLSSAALQKAGVKRRSYMGARSSFRRKKSYRRKRAVNRKPLGLNVRPMTRQLFPKRISTKMVYSEVFDIVQAANTPWFWKYSGNGLNDPNITGGGHQPMGFDQFNPLYINYVVTGVKLILEGVNTAAGGHQVSVQSGTNGLAFVTAPDAINEYRQAYSIMTSNQRPWKFKKYFSNPAVLGIKRSTFLENSDYWGQSTGTTNPTYGTQLYVQIANLDISEQIITSLSVTLVYYVTYFNNQVIAQS